MPQVIPGIMLLTMPKSASVYITQTLSKGLGCSIRSIAPGFFLNDVLILEEVHKLARGNCIGQSHTPPKLVNLSILHRYMDKFIVHTRDPRQATLSWVYHLESLRQWRPYLLLKIDINEPMPNHYFDWTFQEKIDWHITYHLPALIQWLESWVEIDNNPHFRSHIKFTCYEDLHRKPYPFFLDILDFYHISPQQFQMQPPPKKGEDHFRKGELNEWMHMMTDDQQKRATALIPDHLAQRFGWLK